MEHWWPDNYGGKTK